MTTPDLPAKFGNSAVLSAVTPGGLPYPVSTDPANQGANAIKALALALDTSFAGPWTPVPPIAPITGTVLCRVEGASVACVGYFSGTPAGTLARFPVGWRPVFAPGSGQTYYTFIGPAVTSGNSAYGVFRVWGDGSITMTATTGAMSNIDMGMIRFPIRNG